MEHLIYGKEESIVTMLHMMIRLLSMDCFHPMYNFFPVIHMKMQLGGIPYIVLKDRLMLKNLVI